jgi:hypothetical protein
VFISTSVSLSSKVCLDIYFSLCRFVLVVIYHLSALCQVSLQDFLQKLLGSFVPPVVKLNAPHKTSNSSQKIKEGKLFGSSDQGLAAISDQRGKNFASLQPASASAKTKIPAPSAKVVEKSSTFLRTPYRKRLLEVSLRRKYGEIIAKLPTAALAAAIKTPNFYPRIAAAAFGTKEKLPHLPTRESLQLLLLAVITLLQGAPSR